MEKLILDEFMKLNNKRKMTTQEKNLLKELMNRGNFNPPFDWENNLLVSEMDDGNMGSLYLYPSGFTENSQRAFGQQISEYIFKDIDNVDVIASLNLDTDGMLFELDIWKTDFKPTILLSK